MHEGTRENNNNNNNNNKNKNKKRKKHTDSNIFIVLADFEGGVIRLTGRSPNQLSLPAMWKAIWQSKTFYSHLEWMNDGQTLWDFITSQTVKERLREAQKPIILTGLPRNPQRGD